MHQLSTSRSNSNSNASSNRTCIGNSTNTGPQNWRRKRPISNEKSAWDMLTMSWKSKRRIGIPPKENVVVVLLSSPSGGSFKKSPRRDSIIISFNEWFG